MARYTAKEMREAADNFWVGGVISEVKDEDGRVVKHIKHDAVIAMLRQAADMMEREEKREYEYSVYPPEVNGVFKYRAGAELKALLLKQNGYSDKTIIRREVGEWEEVVE